MRLFVDCRYVRTTVHDGISRYTASLVQAAAPYAEVTMLISDPAQLNLLPALPWLRISSPTGPREPLVARQINPHQPDVVFSPMQTMGSIGKKYPLILTLHDLIYYQHRTPPRNLPAPVRAGWRIFHFSYLPQRLLLNRSDAVATVSHTTKNLIAQHRLTTNEVHLIPNAPQPVQQPRPADRPPKKELVYMGSFMEYKNVEALIRAVNQLPEYRLHLCSPVLSARRAQLSGLAQRPGQLLWHHGISEQRYGELLDSATALVTASKAEGYGLPVIEALSRGTPVVASDLPIFSEVAGRAAEAQAVQFTDPDDDAGLAAAVRNLEDPGTFGRASAAALSRAGDYSWEDSAQRLVRLAESLLR